MIGEAPRLIEDLKLAVEAHILEITCLNTVFEITSEVEVLPNPLPHQRSLVQSSADGALPETLDAN